jgi:hypothetical protein
LKEAPESFRHVQRFTDTIENYLIQKLDASQPFLEYIKTRATYQSCKLPDLEFWIDRLSVLYNVIECHVSDSQNLEVCIIYWEKCMAIEFLAEKLVSICETVFYAVRCVAMEDVNIMIDEILTSVKMEGIDLEQRIFEERIIAGFQIPSFNKYIFKSLQRIRVTPDQCLQVALKHKPSPSLLLETVSNLFFMNLLYGRDERFTFAETFEFDLRRMQVLSNELCFFRTLFIFYPIVIGNSQLILKRLEMGIDDDTFVSNLTSFRQSICRSLKTFYVNVNMIDGPPTCSINSTTIGNFRTGMLASNFLTEFETEYILNQSVSEFKEAIFQERFNTM